MFIGHDVWNADAFYFLISHIIQLAVQPESANECTILTVSVEETGELSITDNGRGLPIAPIGFGRRPEQPRIECMLISLWRNHFDRQYYEEFGFLDYLGNVLSAVTAHLQVETNINGERYTLTCSPGKITSPLQKLGLSTERGTRLTFTPDPDLFPDWSFDKVRLSEMLQPLAVQYPQTQFLLI
jgi:DNA gyrase/topoisomerase IV subunit B